MIKITLYLLSIIGLGSMSAWLAQTWRYEGAVEESNKATAGGILFEKLKADAEAMALKIYSEKERDGQTDGSAIEQAGRAAGRKLASQGDGIRTYEETVGERATYKYYLE